MMDERTRAIAIVERVIADLEALEALLCQMLSSATPPSSAPSSLPASTFGSTGTSNASAPEWLTALYKQADAGAESYEGL